MTPADPVETSTASRERPADGATLPRVRAVSRAIAIMRSFTPAEPRLSLSAVAGRAGLDAGTTRRILVTLRDEGVVGQDPQTGLYALTMQAMRFAGAVPEGQSLKDMAEDLLVALARDTGSTAFLSVVEEHEAICIARFHAEAPVQVRWWSVGGTMPLNCGAAPRLLLAHLDEAGRERLLAAPLPAMTPESVTDPARLREILARIRARGWSHATDDVAMGLSALAAPVRDEAGRTVAAVSVGGLAPLIGRAEEGGPEPAILRALLGAAETLSRRLARGYVP